MIFLDENKTEEGGRRTNSTASDTRLEDPPPGGHNTAPSDPSIAMATTQEDPAPGSHNTAPSDPSIAMATTQEDPPPGGHNTAPSDPSVAMATTQEDPAPAAAVDAARVDADEIFDVITQHEVTVSQLEGATDARWVDSLPPPGGAGCVSLGWKVCLPRISEKHLVCFGSNLFVFA